MSNAIKPISQSPKFSIVQSIGVKIDFVFPIHTFYEIFVCPVRSTGKKVSVIMGVGLPIVTDVVAPLHIVSPAPIVKCIVTRVASAIVIPIAVFRLVPFAKDTVGCQSLRMAASNC